ncbi:hypothetical protein [Mesorhizobium sp. LjNodule214]|uniref:hypothetical protein n=1 Tax=Mesorhizobium sp. LjNodule214 TaxID=3342252 RepID=UPI003F4FD858
MACTLFHEKRLQARRDFLKKAGRFAAVTPPAITLLLGASLSSAAIAKSGGSRPPWRGQEPCPPRPPGQAYKVDQGRSNFREGRSDSYGGGSHGSPRSGDPN